jgi:hypothetical protein
MSSININSKNISKKQCIDCGENNQILENQNNSLGEAGLVNKEAKNCILNELLRLLDFLKNRNQRDIKGASILILVDHFSKSYAVKMIDLSSIKIFDDPL